MSFARILRSSALMGGAQVVVLAAGFVRAKVVALILGASGVGLIGIFNVFSGNVATFAGWGLGTSGVRLIAGASEEQKPTKIAAVRRMGWMLGLLGLVLALALFWPVGLLTFASAKYATEMAIVALAVPCVIASTGWSAVLQASGKVASLAKVQMVSALAGLMVGLPAIYFWGTMGIALSILLAALVPAMVLWRTVSAEKKDASDGSAISIDLRQLATLGGALMVVGWLGQLSAYLIRVAIVRQEGLDAAGYYQAAFAISGSLPGFIFAAMGADFLPRVAAAKDEAAARSISEQQIQAGLLMGTPLIVVLLSMGGLCVRLLYADGFAATEPLLSWMAWGVFVRLLAWPLAFWLLARGSSRTMMFIEGSSALLMTALAFLLLKSFGLVGSAMGFAYGQVIYAGLLLWVARRRSGAWVSGRTLGWALLCAMLCLAAQGFASLNLDGPWPYMPGCLSGLVAAGLYIRLIRTP
jgi:enterobacterial common antigen flippase